MTKGCEGCEWDQVTSARQTLEVEHAGLGGVAVSNSYLWKGEKAQRGTGETVWKKGRPKPNGMALTSLLNFKSSTIKFL